MKINVILACAAGMSTSMLVEKIKTAASESGVDINVRAVPTTEVSGIVAYEKVDMILLGPQVRFMQTKIQAEVPRDVPVDVINSMDYGTMNGANVLKLINSKVKNK